MLRSALESSRLGVYLSSSTRTNKIFQITAFSAKEEARKQLLAGKAEVVTTRFAGGNEVRAYIEYVLDKGREGRQPTAAFSSRKYNIAKATHTHRGEKVSCPLVGNKKVLFN